MEYIIYSIGAILFSFYAAFDDGYNRATIYWGRKLVGLESHWDEKDYFKKIQLRSDSVIDKGIQNKLVTKEYAVRFYIKLAINIIFLILGLLFLNWYLSILGLFFIFIFRNLFSGLFKPNSNFYKDKIIKNLENQRKSFEKDGLFLKESSTIGLINKIKSYT